MGRMMNPECFLIGNGKLFQNRLYDVSRHASVLAREISNVELHHTLVAYAPPIPFLIPVGEALKGTGAGRIELASQTVSARRHGMETGGVPADGLRDLGVTIAIVNHSEQKANLRYAPTYHKSVSLQISNALECGLRVVLCCGEDDGKRGAERYASLESDVYQTLDLLSPAARAASAEALLIAYEPQGSIGTGRVAPISQIQQTFEDVRGFLLKAGLDRGIRFMYGGGVNLENIEELHYGLSFHERFGGYLVGEATTRPVEFVEIAKRLEASVVGSGPLLDHQVKAVQRGAFRLAEPAAHSKLHTVGAITPVGKTRVAIVGFGEIGAATAIVSALDPTRGVEVVQVFNQYLSPKDAHARVVQSRYIDPEDASYFTEGERSFLRIRSQVSELTPHDSLEDAARQLNDIDVVVFTAGDYTKDQAAFLPFLRERGGAKAVLVTCATPAADFSIVPGFNHHLVNPRQHPILALGSCTGNCAVPILAVIEEQFGEGSIRGGYAVAPHSKTNTQEIGNKGADPKKESILGNLIPTSTGLGKLLQQPGFFSAMSESTEAVSIRTPTEDVSLLCLSVDVEGAEDATTADVAAAFREASKSPRWNGIIGVEEAHGTKMFWKDRRACVVYEPYVRVMPKYLRSGVRSPLSTVTVIAAYANVFGYSWQVVRGVAALRLGRTTLTHSPNSTDREPLVAYA